MVVLHCSRKLLDKIKQQPSEILHDTDNLLGPWYLDALIAGQKHYVVAFNSNSALTVVLAYSDARKDFGAALRNALDPLLAELGVSADTRATELHAFAEVAFAKATDKSAISHLARQKRETSYALERTADLHTINLRFGEYIITKAGKSTHARDYIVAYEELGRLLNQPTIPPHINVERIAQASEAYLQGFFAAIISMPPFVQPSEWLHGVLDDVYAGQPLPNGLEEMNKRLGHLMGLYNSMATVVPFPDENWTPAYERQGGGTPHDYVAGYSEAMHRYNREHWLETMHLTVKTNPLFRGLALLLSDASRLKLSDYDSAVFWLYRDTCLLFRQMRGL